MLRFTCVLTAAVAFAFASPHRGEPENSGRLGRAPAGDLDLMQGRWKAWLGAEDSMLFEVKDGSFTLTLRLAGQCAEPWTGTLRLDEEPRPRHLTWSEVKCAGQELPENRCIYELHGDTLLLIGGGRDRRPERFFSGEGKGDKTWVFKREKAKS